MFSGINGTGGNPRTQQCEPCPVGTKSDASLCISCGSSGYTLRPRQSACHLCNEPGVTCSDGLASIDRGYWPWIDAKTGGIRTAVCPPGLCEGGPALNASCALNRAPVGNNTL